jgi:hypothetical protein
MKNFIFKILIIILAFFFTYHITIGPQIQYFKNKIDSLYKYKNKNERENLKKNLRKDLTLALEKDKILDPEDKILIKKIIKKIQDELKD